MLSLAILASVLAMLTGIVFALVSKKVARYFGKTISPLTTVGISIIPMIIIGMVFGMGSLPTPDVYLSLAAGFFLALGFILRYDSIYTEQVTNIAVLGQAQPIVVILAGVFLLDEHLTFLQIASMLIIFVGTFLVATTEKFEINRRLIPAFLGSASWGVYWILIAYSVNDSSNFILSLITARIAGILILLAFIVISGNRAKKGASLFENHFARNALLFACVFAAIAGIANGVGDSLFGIVAAYKLVAVGSAINAALGPVIVAALAYLIYKDKLSRMQAAGFAITLVGVFFLTLG